MQPGCEEIIVLDGLWMILLLAALPGAGNLAGGLIAEVWRSTPAYLNWALHAASGIVIAVVAVEILPEALRSLAGWWIALAFLAGGMAYIAIETMIDRLRSGGPADDGGSMWMIYVAVAMDLTSDGLLIGTGSAVSPALALALAAGQVLADVPEGYAAIANLRDKGVVRWQRLLLALSFFMFAIGAALISFFLLRAAPEEFKAAALVFVAGLLTVAAVEDMLEEAHDAREDNRRSVLAFVGGFALFTVVSAGLDRLVGGERASPGAAHHMPAARHGMHLAPTEVKNS